MLDVDLDNPPYTAMMALSPQYDVSDAVDEKDETTHTLNTNKDENMEFNVNRVKSNDIKQEKADCVTDNKKMNKVKNFKWFNEWPTFCTPHLPSTPS